MAILKTTPDGKLDVVNTIDSLIAGEDVSKRRGQALLAITSLDSSQRKAVREG